MKLRSAVIMLATAALICAGAARAEVRLRLHDEVELLTANYRLGDIATVQAADAALQRELAALVVGRSPRPGYWGHATRQQLSAAIDRAFPGLYRELAWAGAAKTRIRAGGAALAGERIEEAASVALSERLGAEYERFSIGAVESPSSLLVPAGEVRLSAKLPSELWPDKRTPVRVDVEIDGMPYQTVMVWFSVSAFAEVLVAKRDLPPLAAPAEASFRRDYRDIAGLKGAPVTDSATLAGMRLKQRLAEGSVVTADMLEALPAVVKGQQVTVFAGAGHVILRTTAVALSDGVVSEKIRVRRVGDSINYSAVVVGPGRVRVD